MALVANPNHQVGYADRAALGVMSRRSGLGLKKSVTSSAPGIRSFKLHQFAMRVAAAQNFPRFHTRKGGGHSWLRSARAGSPRRYFAPG
jgi:hypothetical protein